MLRKAAQKLNKQKENKNLRQQTFNLMHNNSKSFFGKLEKKKTINQKYKKQLI